MTKAFVLIAVGLFTIILSGLLARGFIWYRKIFFPSWDGLGLRQVQIGYAILGAISFLLGILGLYLESTQ